MLGGIPYFAGGNPICRFSESRKILRTSRALCREFHQPGVDSEIAHSCISDMGVGNIPRPDPNTPRGAFSTIPAPKPRRTRAAAQRGWHPWFPTRASSHPHV
jgi:hypothetical protein